MEHRTEHKQMQYSYIWNTERTEQRQMQYSYKYMERRKNGTQTNAIQL